MGLQLTRSFLRYALQLVDTVLVGADKSSCLTTGVKSIKDTLFFLNKDEADGQASKVPTKRAPAVKNGTNGNPSPVKNKTTGGKVLRNKTRSAAQQELVQSMAAKIAEHQRELHAKLHQEGLARFSEGGGGIGGKEGKGWKRFQSYKGEAGLPREVENLRVGLGRALKDRAQNADDGPRSSSIGRHRPLSSLFTASLYPSTSTPSRTSARTMRASSLTSVLTSRHLVSSLDARRTRSVHLRLGKVAD